MAMTNEERWQIDTIMEAALGKQDKYYYVFAYTDSAKKLYNEMLSPEWGYREFITSCNAAKNTVRLVNGSIIEFKGLKLRRD